MFKLCSRALPRAASGLLVLAVAGLSAPPIQISITAADLFAGQPGKASFFPVHKVQGGAPLQPSDPQISEILAVPSVPSPGYYRDDVSNPLGNPTLCNVVNHNVFVNPIVAGSTYALSSSGPLLTDVDTFETKLFGSSMIHIEDQYTGGSCTPTVGTDAVITFITYKTIYSDAELGILVHAAGRVLGTGPGHFIHLFFKQGQDVCTTFGGGLINTTCYSPDNFSTFSFCAFHDDVTFSDIGTVVLSIEPFANTPGCRVPTGSPNGRNVDSMANVLSHEIFEGISDPFPNSATGWYNHLTGEEIGDICAQFVFDVTLGGGMKYRIQSEYSNFYHACSWAP